MATLPGLGVSVERGPTHGGSAEPAPPQREPRAGRAAGRAAVGSVERGSCGEGLGTLLSQCWRRSSGTDGLSGKPKYECKRPGGGQAFSNQPFNKRNWNKRVDCIPDAQIRLDYFLLCKHTEDYHMSCYCFPIKTVCDSTVPKAS